MTGGTPSGRPDRSQYYWYNGWSPAERSARTPVQQEAIRSGAIATPKDCSICGTTATAANGVWLHDENYDDPLAAYHICRACHLTLHRRFDNPEPWQALVARHGNGSRWFEGLSMDPQSRWRPFTETYPNGLPAD